MAAVAGRGKLQEDNLGSGEDLGRGRDLRPWPRTWRRRLQDDGPGGREDSSAAVAGMGGCTGMEAAGG